MSETNQRPCVLLLGGGGMLGHKLAQVFQDHFETYVTLRKPLENYRPLGLFELARTFDGIDIEDKKKLAGIFEELKPAFTVNCIGIIKQLPEAKDPILNIKVNALFPHELEKMVNRAGGKLIHISTDCVFSGKRGNYTEEDFSDAEDLYGRTKFLGEVTTPPSLTIRTSIIGRELFSSFGFLEWALNRKPKERVRGFTRGIFSGLTTQALAETLVGIIKKHPTLNGLYHVASQPISKYDLLKRLQKKFDLDMEIHPDDAFQCDRSLDGSRFRKETDLHSFSWDEMIDGLKREDDFYKRREDAAYR